MMRWLTRGVVAFSVATASVYGGACLSPDESEQPVDPAFADVVFEGDTSDTALASLLEVAPVRDVLRGPRMVSPSADSVLEAASVITFEWTPNGATAARAPGAPRAPTPLLNALAAPERQPSLAWLAALLGPEGEAHAARPAMLGPGYFLLFSTPESPRLLRVFTTHTRYTPDENAWAQLRTAGTWTKLIVVSAGFARDAMLPGTGPFQGDPIEFCIEEH